MPIKPSLSATLLEARAWKRSTVSPAVVKPRHALSVSLWTGLVVTALTTVIITTQVIGGPATEASATAPQAYADPHDIYPDTADVVREKLDVRPVLPARAEIVGRLSYAFVPSSYEATAYRPVTDRWTESSDSYSEPNTPSGDKAAYLAPDEPATGVMICTDVCRDAESDARETVEPLPTAAPVIQTDQAPVVPATTGAPVIIETPSGG